MVEEDERALVLRESPEPPVIIVPPSPSRQPRGPRSLLVGVVLGALLVVVIFYALGRFPRTGEVPTVVVTATPSAQETEAPVVEYREVTVEVTTTPAPAQDTPTPVDQTPVATEAPVVVTATPAPPQDTPTPRPVSMPLPFEDDFDEGPRPEWETVLGTWRMVDGTYTADGDGWAYTMVGDPG